MPMNNLSCSSRPGRHGAFKPNARKHRLQINLTFPDSLHSIAHHRLPVTATRRPFPHVRKLCHSRGRESTVTTVACLGDCAACGCDSTAIGDSRCGLSGARSWARDSSRHERLGRGGRIRGLGRGPDGASGWSLRDRGEWIGSLLSVAESADATTCGEHRVRSLRDRSKRV
jgi:hypothetical protein